MAQLFGDNDTESTKRHDFDFAKSTFVAEIDTRQGGMRKLITHVSFVHWWDAHYYYQLTARGRKREWKTRVTSKPATSFRYKCRCLQCNSVLHDETLITSSRRKKKGWNKFLLLYKECNQTQQTVYPMQTASLYNEWKSQCLCKVCTVITEFI